MKEKEAEKKPDIISRGAQTDGSLCSGGQEVPPTKKVENQK